jgi:hypothetical protein
VIGNLRHRARSLLHGRDLLGIAFAFCAGWALHHRAALSEESAARSQGSTALEAYQPPNEELVQNDPGSPAVSSTRRAKRPGIEAVVFLLAAIALVGFGWWLLPDTTPPHVVPGFSIHANGFTASTKGIVYIETHPRDNVIDAQVTADFGRHSAPAGSQLEIYIQLPDNVRYQSCEAINSDVRVRCFYTPFNEAKADVSLLSGAVETEILFHLSGPGLGFVESDGQVAAELPILLPDVAPGPGLVAYRIKDVSRYQWSGEQPTASLSEAIWSEPRATMHQLAATGVRGDVQSRNSDLIFAAGVIVGTAGAALIAAGQATFKWLADE